MFLSLVIHCSAFSLCPLHNIIETFYSVHTQSKSLTEYIRINLTGILLINVNGYLFSGCFSYWNVVISATRNTSIVYC